MKHTSPEFKSAMSDVKAKIALTKRRGTKYGFVDYHDCMWVCRDFIDILKEALILAERGEYTLAYSIAVLIELNLAKLVQKSDDSAGGITDARHYVDDVLAKVCKCVEHGSAEANYIFTQSLKDSKNQAFEQWDDFSYDILLRTACLVTDKTVQKLYETLDSITERISKSSQYGSWCLKYDALVRLEAIRTVEGELAADSFIEKHLQIDDIRKEAVKRALAKCDYAHAEKLCLEKLEDDSARHEWSRPSEWRYLLYEIYNMSDNTEKKIEFAESLLFRFDISYYEILKQLLTEQGVWEQEYESLLARMNEKLPHQMFMAILSAENENQKLFIEIQKKPFYVFTYGKQLCKDYANDIYRICLDEIRKQVSEATDRKKYKKACANIKRLYEYGGIQEAEDVVSELKEKYPRRTALIEELDSVKAKIAKAQAKYKK